ncbi:hypothetical protein EXN66_Car018024 [Channa argus]|uniref:Uncharacterized protein n=1 Tax=Channa argus TaxID=215402 RepID=A0A6G1QJR4_CHAAH|nr:hypothetical protein EXN66_Car018024 [Channa argus]
MVVLTSKAGVKLVMLVTKQTQCQFKIQISHSSCRISPVTIKRMAGALISGHIY